MTEHLDKPEDLTIESISGQPSPSERVARSCNAPRHQYGIASFCQPNTSASKMPMIGAWSSMMLMPPTSRTFTLK